ncbi:MAG TPA: NAD+ synthase [Deltaproteobacteria bacterium]|nr:MAG: NAD+ synthase [Deltaproteobacteria bacterium GWA2_55_82]OGQ62006.1 MAG: NAD+ synthase [Deltaproteobacteria bacterium RIFCSPLOWO2_02_FULL_55_12]OIJ74136.1 MAG: NAD+ synthase [Deltaproteobacteria bacterium GWC2_55_46]HBG46754.1 NAD+ synthase [Deltaproteobacteria bacterium]HCY11237.1 NAD+ synthase [Deltaproteobacteria bacterium]
MRRLRLAMAQINPTVGDIRGNAKKILSYTGKAKKAGAGLILFPELSLTGYPPEDLLLKPGFIDDNLKALKVLARKISGITAIVGFVDRKADIYNAAAIVHGGKVAAVYHKMYLPNYGVFDEQRYFQAGTDPLNFVLGGITIGIEICEDIWYPDGPARAQCLAGAELIVNINASPYHTGKAVAREEMLVTRARDNEVIIAYNNTVGGQDELVFDGRGMVVDERGEIIARGRAFEEDLIITDLDIDSISMVRLHDPRRREAKRMAPQEVKTVDLGALPKKTKLQRLAKKEAGPLNESEEVLKALILGTGDYVRKNGFNHVVVGLSGGIDSSLVASVACLALGKENITGVLMPSRYTSKESIDDAASLARNLGIKKMTIPIDDTYQRYLDMMRKAFSGTRPNEAEENMQARIRGNILMALSNKFGWLVLTTGNKSEMSVGYATLYGDMAGGFAVIKDVPKTLVYRVSQKLNELEGSELIPQRVFTKAPTAELRPDQTDQDTLPPYDTLDRILKAYVEEDRSIEEIAMMGFGKELVRKVASMVDSSEYKRRQAPPGVKITPRALGKDRRMPITNRYENGGR